jgi:N-acetylglucosamine-6-phosphate deacetylase
MSPHRLPPGPVDLHLHGWRGLDAQSPDPAELLRLSQLLGREGIAGFLATYVSAPRPALLRSLRAVRAAAGRETGARAARILGVHLEGPFLAPAKRGAHPASDLRKPSLPEAREWLAAAGGLLKVVTLAPELPGAGAVIRLLRGRGVRVQMGHTCATVAQARAAKARGIAGVTHLFNAMGPKDRKDLGAAWMALHDRSLATELIGDGVHVSDGLLRHTLHIRPADKVHLVSDTCAASGFAPGRRGRFAGGPVVTGPDGSVRRSDGSLAASGLSLPQAVHRMRKAGLLTPAQARRLARTNPLRYIGA